MRARVTLARESAVVSPHRFSLSFARRFSFIWSETFTTALQEVLPAVTPATANCDGRRLGGKKKKKKRRQQGGDLSDPRERRERERESAQPERRTNVVVGRVSLTNAISCRGCGARGIIFPLRALFYIAFASKFVQAQRLIRFGDWRRNARALRANRFPSFFFLFFTSSFFWRRRICDGYHR